MIEQLRRALEQSKGVAYALLFGSMGRGTAHARSDVDVAIGLLPGERLDALAFGELVSRLEAAAGRPVDLVLLEEAPPGLAYRVFRDGVVLFEADHRALVERKARSILEYLDYKPVEELFAREALAAAARGR